jgi:hypothetical protein
MLPATVDSAGTEIASTSIYSLPGCGLEPSMADELDLPIDDIFAREIVVPKAVAACVDAALDQVVGGDVVASELQISSTLARQIATAPVDRNRRRGAYYAAYRLPLLPAQHKAVLVSAHTDDVLIDLAAHILRARGAQQIVVVKPSRQLQ